MKNDTARAGTRVCIGRHWCTSNNSFGESRVDSAFKAHATASRHRRRHKHQPSQATPRRHACPQKTCHIPALTSQSTYTDPETRQLSRGPASERAAPLHNN
eukprot:354848-Chlamydomonas_euryale.AAC.2